MAQFLDGRYVVFKSQNRAEGFFDVTFDVEGKLIHAHKYMLSTVSDVLLRMISGTWNNGETIKIETYSFNDFYEFLTFLYSGNCKLNDENILTMVDLSEFYQVKVLQQKCDEYLSHKEYTNENVLTYFETLSKYSLRKFEKAISKSMKYLNFVESESFMQVSKKVILKILKFKYRIASEEKLFEKIYEWAQKRAKNKQTESTDENIILNDGIKSELTEILPFIRFKKMKLDFLHTFVVKKGFLFSYDELSEILNVAKGKTTFYVKIKITNSNGKSIICMLPNNSDIVDNIKSLKNHPCDCLTTQYTYWNGKQIEIPSIPSQIKKRDGIEWYLFCDSGGIGVVHHSYYYNDVFLLAEMTPETSDFVFTENCKIDIE
uniref:BTB domain-containing protein n=1 Tax=Panagrolaimus davidi TaxID=227884 RepID=A0A914R1U0_9BILA